MKYAPVIKTVHPKMRANISIPKIKYDISADLSFIWNKHGIIRENHTDIVLPINAIRWAKSGTKILMATAAANITTLENILKVTVIISKRLKHCGK